MRAPREQDGTIVRRRRFAQVPDEIVIDSRLSHGAVRLWCRLDHYAGADGQAFPGQATLAADLSVSVPTVARWLAELVDTGWITRARRGFTNIVDTALNDPPVPPVRIATGHDGNIRSDTPKISTAGSPEISAVMRPEKETHGRRPTRRTDLPHQSRSDLTSGTREAVQAATRQVGRSSPPRRPSRAPSPPRPRRPRTATELAAIDLLSRHGPWNVPEVQRSWWQGVWRLRAHLDAAPDQVAAVEQMAELLGAAAGNPELCGRLPGRAANWAIRQAILDPADTEASARAKLVEALGVPA